MEDHAARRQREQDREGPDELCAKGVSVAEFGVQLGAPQPHLQVGYDVADGRRRQRRERRRRGGADGGADGGGADSGGGSGGGAGGGAGGDGGGGFGGGFGGDGGGGDGGGLGARVGGGSSRRRPRRRRRRHLGRHGGRGGAKGGGGDGGCGGGDGGGGGQPKSCSLAVDAGSYGSESLHSESWTDVPAEVAQSPQLPLETIGLRVMRRSTVPSATPATAHPLPNGFGSPARPIWSTSVFVGVWKSPTKSLPLPISWKVKSDLSSTCRLAQSGLRPIGPRLNGPLQCASTTALPRRRVYPFAKRTWIDASTGHLIGFCFSCGQPSSQMTSA